MKRIDEIFNFKIKFFDYKSYISPNIYQHSIYYEGEKSSSIYVDNPVIKYAVEEMRVEILNAIRECNPNILELKVYIDKDKKIAARNARQKKVDVKNDDDYKKDLPTLDEVMAIYNNLNEMKFKNEKEKEYFIGLLRKYAKEYDKKIEECKFCGLDKKKGEDCINCLILNKNREIEDAMREIENNNCLQNNGKLYIKARKKLFDKYFSQLLSFYYNDKFYEFKEEELFKKCAIIKLGSEDPLSVSLVISDLERRIKKFVESNINFNYE